MEKKHIILIIVVGILIFGIGFGATYLIVTNNDNMEFTNNLGNNNSQNDKEDGNSQNNNKENNNEKPEYSKVTIGTKTANDIVKIIPTVNSIYTLRNINEYKIFTALDKLIKDKKVPSQTMNETLIAYTKKDIIKQAKIMYGEEINLDFDIEFETPIYIDKEKQLYTIPPYGKVDREEYISVYEIKENNEEYLVNVYVVMLYYDIDSESNKTYINTQDSFNSMVSGKFDNEKLKEEMKLIKTTENKEIYLDEIVEEYKDILPKLQYKIIKDLENENGMYIKEVVYVK